jgi:nicotinate phosphoribosyltransferase
VQSTDEQCPKAPTYAEVFSGIRQDSGDPKEYVKLASDFYKSIGITGKAIVFSDSLDVDKCLEYKEVAEAHGLKPSFGVGTFFTNDFRCKSDGQTRSKPLNIVIKISKAGGNPAVKISDILGKNTGNPETVEDVKKRLGYLEKTWSGGDESKR